MLIDRQHRFYNDVMEYLEKNNYIGCSDLYVTELTEDFKIIGVLGIQTVCKFEPLITNNSMTAKTLYDTAMGVVLDNGKFNRIEVSISDTHWNIDNLKSLYEKFGFIFIEKVNKFVKMLIK